MKFNYFYGSQADQFSFIRIPKIMLTDNVFQTLSMGAKVLYGVLLDRMNLSMKNGWLDEEKRVFIIYQIGEIQEDLGFSKKKAIDLLTELETFGLLQKKRRGHGLPNILYVKNFMTESDARGSEMGTSDLPEAVSRSEETGTQEVTKPALQEVSDPAPLKSKTNISNTYRSNTKSNLIISTESRAESDAIRRDEIKSADDLGVRARIYEQIIRENISYNGLLLSHPEDRALIEGIVDLILETVVGTQSEILIASGKYPAQVVKSKFLKLNHFHIEYVLSCLKQNTTSVKNIRKYLLAALFNAPSTMDGYYQAKVNHDMPQYAMAR